MKEFFWTPRRRKAGLFSLAGVSVLLIFLLLTINNLLSPIIARKIKNAVKTASKGVYQLTFSKLKVNIFTGTAILEDVRLIADTGKSDSVSELYSGMAKRVTVSGAHPLLYWLHKKLEIGQVTVSEPVASLVILKTVPAKPDNHQTIYEQLSGSLRSVHVGTIDLEHVQLTYKDSSENYRLRELSLVATDLLIDSATQKDKSRTLYCRDIQVGIRNFHGALADGTYHYQLHSAHFSTLSKKLVLRGITVQPLPAETFFSRTKADRFTFELDSMVLDHFNYQSFQQDHFLEVKRLSAYQGKLGIFSNPNGVLARMDRVVTFPNYIIRKIKTHFTIDTLDMANFDVSYNEFNKKPGKTGTLIFKDTRAHFFNISNEDKRLQNYQLGTASLSTVFMGAAKLDLFFTFNLTDKVYAYSYKGHLAPMPLEVINPVIMPLALAKVTSGTLNSLDFAISGNQEISTGTLKLLYRNLKIVLLDRNYHEKPIKTFVANTLVVSKDNPDEGKLPRFAKVNFIRPKNYPFFATLWATLLSGIKPCAGIGYAVTPDPGKSLSKKELKAQAKAMKKAVKAKKKADKQYQKL